MALGTITKVADYTVANKRYRVRDVQLTSGANYATGGEAISPADVGLRLKIEKVEGSVAKTSAGSTAHIVDFDYTNKKLIAYSSNGAAPAALAELGANANLSTFTARLTFIGT